ncbi:MAG: type II toxin-antitoxin system HicA family toxin [Cyclobacteriaceae bacterium]
MGDFSSKELIKRLLKSGYELHRIKGSHHIYKNKLGKRVVVPHPKKDLPKGTFYSILKQADLG